MAAGQADHAEPTRARAVPFGIRPTTLKIEKVNGKGYYAEAFTEAWSRYLDGPNRPPNAPEGGRSVTT